MHALSSGTRTLGKQQARGIPQRGMSRPSPQVCRATDPKEQCARLFVDEFVRDNQVIGTGSGELSSLAIQSIGARIAAGQLKGIQAVATDVRSAAEAAFSGVPTHPNPDQALQDGLDLAFEEADQLDTSQSACIIGTHSEPQQPALLQAYKIVKRAKQFVLLVNADNILPRLKGPVPVLVEDESWEEIAEEVDDIVVGDAEVSRRPVSGLPNHNHKGGDQPYVSEEGHALLDITYEEDIRLFGEPKPYSEVLENIQNVPGVVLTGLLIGQAQAAVVAKQEGAEVVQLNASGASLS